jgi:hypothetical protein
MNDKIDSEDEAREAIKELSGDSRIEVKASEDEGVKSIVDYLESHGPLNPAPADILADFYSLYPVDGVVGASTSSLDRQNAAEELYLNVSPELSLPSVIWWIEDTGYNLSRINLRDVETLWEEDGVQYFRSDKGYYATLVFEASNPTESLEALIEYGCSPAEALDYWATELKNGTGVSVQEWSKQRGISKQAVSANTAEASKKIPDTNST